MIHGNISNKKILNILAEMLYSPYYKLFLYPNSIHQTYVYSHCLMGKNYASFRVSAT